MNLKKILSIIIVLYCYTDLLSQYNMTTNNSQTVTATNCAGILTDTPSGNYSSGTTQTITIRSPNPGEGVCLDFTSWDLNYSNLDTYPGSTTNLIFYDGPNTSSPLIYGATGDWIVNQSALIGNQYDFSGPGMICSSGGELTIQFVRRGSASGFSANISCLTPPINNTCSINISSNFNNICLGETASLTVTGKLSSPLMNNNFNDGTIGQGWSSSINARFDNPCELGLDGSTHFWIGTNNSPRDFTSVPFDVTLGGSVYFEIDFANQGSGAPCEGPDEPTEGVYFQYSTNGGTNWNTMHYFFPSFYTDGSDNIQSWQGYYFNIPPAARTSNTQFRWTQRKISSNTTDHWGLDNIKIITPKPTTIRIKENSNTGAVIASSTTSPLNYSVSPTTTTTYYATISDGIDSCTQQITVNVDPCGCIPPIITSNPVSSSICSGNNTSFTVAATGGNGQYQWQVDTGLGFVDITNSVVYSGTASASLTINGATETMNTYQYQCIVLEAVGTCPVTSSPAILTVNPLNTVTAASSSPTTCINTAITSVTHTTTSASGIGTTTGLPLGISANWASNTITISGTPSVSGTFNYSIPLTGGCGTVNATGTITVNPSTTPTFTAVAPICSGATLAALPTASTNGTWAPALNNTATTTYTFTPTAGQCATTTTLTITVNPIQTPSISCGTSTSTSVQFNWTALTGASNYAITYTINGGSSQTGGSVAASTFSLASLTPGDVVAITIVTIGTGCYASGTNSCTAQACTAPTITTQPVAQSGCEGQPATFSVAATGGSGYQWEVSTDGGTIFTSVVNGGLYSGATTNTLSISNNTGLNTYLYRVVVAETNALCPTTSLSALLTVTSIQTPSISCGTSTSTSVQFNWTALTGASNYAVTYTINGSSSQTGGSVAASTFSLASLTPGDVVAITIVTIGTGCYANRTSSCTAQACTAPTITTQPVAQSGCEGKPATFSVAATGGSGYQWEVSTDGGTIFTSVVNGGLYSGATSATLAITDNTGLDTYTYRVVVAETNALCPTTSLRALLTATSIQTPSISCGTSTISSVQFNWTALTGATSYAISYTINAGASQSGGSVATPTFSLSSLSPGDVVAITIVTIGTGCYASGTNSCTALACTTPSLTITDPVAVCAPLTVDITDTGVTDGSTGSGDLSYYSDILCTIPLPDANSISIGGSYYIKSTLGTCSDSKLVTVTINSTPILVTTSPSSVCFPSQVDITTPGITSGSISLGVNTYHTTAACLNSDMISNQLASQIANSGTYYIKSTTGNCFDIGSITVTITPQPVIIFGAPATGNCEPNKIDLTDPTLTTGNTVGATNEYWSNAAGTNALITPNAVTTGTYYVSNTLAGCRSIVHPVTVIINPKPIADFTPTPSLVSTLNATSTMMNSSIGAQSYEWGFDDGTNPDITINPTHLFPAIISANYNVYLIATATAGNCKDTIVKTVKVYEELLYFIPNTFTPDDDYNNYNNIFQPRFVSGYDPYTFTMLIFNRWGEIVFESHNASVGWDGSYQKSKEKAPDGTYTWKIDFTLKVDGTKKQITGNVNLIK